MTSSSICEAFEADTVPEGSPASITRSSSVVNTTGASPAEPAVETSKPVWIVTGKVCGSESVKTRLVFATDAGVSVTPIMFRYSSMCFRRTWFWR